MSGQEDLTVTISRRLYPWFPILFILAACLVPSRCFASAGVLSEAGGEVYFREKASVSYRIAKKGMTFEPGCRFKTGPRGWAVLVFSDKSRMTLADNTEFEITGLVVSKNRKQGLFNLVQGKLRASVVRIGNEKVDYKVKSPTAVAGIKGTEFLMMTQGEANVFFGNEGVAEISGETGPGKPLSAGTMVENTRNLTPVDPVKVEPGTPLYEARAGFNGITSGAEPASWDASAELPLIMARWNINYGHYLADSGRYDEALHVFQIALDLCSLSDIRADARLERGAVFSRFLNNPEAALAEYLLVLEEYPASAQKETALYLAGMSLYELGQNEKASERLSQYLREHPSGKYFSSAGTILNLIEKQRKPPTP